jgi:hypothetical protein
VTAGTTSDIIAIVPYRVAVYVNGKRAHTVKVRSNQELYDMMPDIIKRVTRKGLGIIDRLVEATDKRITAVHLNNSAKKTGKEKPPTNTGRGKLPKCFQVRMDSEHT